MSERGDESAPIETADAHTSVARVGRYAILGALGRGGMGEVFRARAFGAAGATKDVCLKRIGASRLSDRRSVARFVDEARLSLALTHANIVSTFDFGRAENDYYLAMEWIDGADLARVIDGARARPFSPGIVAHVGAEVARALAYAHEPTTARPGIVHCDVKPSNVLVSRSGDVLLADFGVAVVRLEGVRGGTPRYMAPEQTLGSEVGPAVDVFALGIVLDVMLEQASERPRDLAELIARMTDAAPETRPVARAVASALERMAARARVDGETSPRDELGARAALAAPVLDATPSLLVPESSYLRDGEDETQSRLTETTHSRSTPLPPPPRSPRRFVVLGLAVVMLASLALAVGRRSTSRPTPASAPASPRGLAASAPSPSPMALPSSAPSPQPASAPEAPAATPVRPRRPRPIEAPEAADVVLRVNAIPWATVELDGRALGTTPLTEVRTRVGEHVLRFRNDVLGVDRVEHLSITGDEPRDVIVDLRE